MELLDIIEDYELQTKRIEQVNDLIENFCSKIKYVDKLIKIKGIGMTTIAGFIAELGDITRFDNAKDLQKLAGLEIVSYDSGKNRGRKRVSKRLRYLLVQVTVSVIGKNDEFKKIYQHYLTRDNNLLKKMQALVAVACKLIRLFHVILTKGVDYDASKMLGDIRRPGEAERKGGITPEI